MPVLSTLAMSLMLRTCYVTQIKDNGNGGYFSIRRVGESQARVGLVREV